MTSDIRVIDAMDEAQAREHVIAINGAASDIGRRLLELREREGWRALGYGSFTAMLAAEFQFARSYLYVLMQAAPVQERLSTIVDKLSVHVAAALAQYEPELQAPIARAALARFGKLTASNVQAMGSPIQAAVQTGHADLADGSSTPLEAALTVEQHESMKRQQEYIADKQKPRELVLVLEGAHLYDYRAGVVAFRVAAPDVEAFKTLADERGALIVKVYRESGV